MVWTLTDAEAQVITFDFPPRNAGVSIVRKNADYTRPSSYPFYADIGTEKWTLELRADFKTQSEVDKLVLLGRKHAKQPVVLSGSTRYNGTYMTGEVKVQQKYLRWECTIKLLRVS